MGGSGDSKAAGMVTDNQNNIYVTGYFTGTVDFDPSAGVKNLTSVGGDDIYVAKYASDGTLIWAVSMGGNGLDQVNNMTVDASGNPTIIGQYQSNVLNAGAFALANQGAEDTFIIHMDPSNGNVVWAKTIGSSGTDRGEEVTTDAQGNLIATTVFQGTVTVGGSPVTAQGGGINALIIKYDSAGNLLWDLSMGSVAGDTWVYGNGIDANGNIIVSGTFSGSVDFDPNGIHHVVNGGTDWPFVAKYTPAGKLIWVNTAIGNLKYNGSVITVDSNNDIYFTGAFSSSMVFGATTVTASGNQDTFIVKYLSDGTLQFAKDLGGSGASSFPYQIRNDKNNNVYITGYFSGTIDFNPDPTATAPVSYHGQQDFFLAKYDSNGNYQWAFSAGSPACSSTSGVELSIDNNNDILLAGGFCQTVDFDPSTCATDNVTAQNFQSDTYLVKYVQSASLTGEITGLTMPEQISPAVIDQVNHTITITVAYNANIKALTPTITISGGTLSPASGVTQDFTSPVPYTLTFGCTAIPWSVKVILAAPPTPVTTCSGTSNIITGDAVNPIPGSYLWQELQNGTWVNAPGVVSNKDYQTSALINNGTADVVFSLRRQITTSGVISYDSFYDVTVQSSAAIANNVITAPGVAAFCTTGDPAAITGSVPTGGNGVYTYQWQSSTDNVTFNDISGATAKDFDPPVANATIYYRRIVTSGTCASPSTSNVITISVFSIVANNAVTAPAVTSFCSNGDPGAIIGSTPTGGNNAYAFQWQSSIDNTTFNNIAGAIAKDYDPPVLNTTTYYRRTVISGACVTPLISNVVTITVTASPGTPVPTQSVVPICAGNSATLSVSSPQQGVTYDWYDSPAKTNHLFTGVSYVTPVLNNSQTYYIEATAGTCTSPALASVQVMVGSPPTAPSVGNPGIVCSGSVATLSVLNPQAGLTYNWYSSATGSSSIFMGANFVTPALSANAVYYVEAANNGGCVSATRTPVSVTVNALPQVTTQGASVCPGTSATVTASSTDANAIITWFASATGGNPLSTGNTFLTPAVNAATTYYAEATDNVSNCSSAARVPVQVQVIQALPAPTVSVGATTTSSVTFQWDAVNGATGYQVSVDNGQTFTDPSSGSNGLTHTVSGLQAQQSVTIVVRAVGSSSCALSNNSTAVTGIAASPLGDQIFVPNAFTPNGDGRNDIVYVHSTNIRSLKFYIYDQWGELLYTSLNQSNGWDGTYKGTKEPVGVYVYYLEATMNDGLLVNKKGTITLLR